MILLVLDFYVVLAKYCFPYSHRLQGRGPTADCENAKDDDLHGETVRALIPVGRAGMEITDGAPHQGPLVWFINHSPTSASAKNLNYFCLMALSGATLQEKGRTLQRRLAVMNLAETPTPLRIDLAILICVK